MPTISTPRSQPRVELYVPTRADLDERRRWLLDPEMMAYNAGWAVPHPGYDNTTGCIQETATEQASFLSKYQDPAKAGYFYLRERSSGQFVGHVHHRMSTPDRADIGVNIIPTRRHQGLGLEGLQLLLDHVWATTQAAVVCNDFEDDRTSAVHLHTAARFQPGQTTLVAGRPVRHWRLPRPER